MWLFNIYFLIIYVILEVKWSRIDLRNGRLLSLAGLGDVQSLLAELLVPVSVPPDPPVV